jgi:hypothetical protein
MTGRAIYLLFVQFGAPGRQIALDEWLRIIDLQFARWRLVKVSTASHIRMVIASSKADSSRAFSFPRSAMKNYAKRSSSLTPVAILCVPILIAMTLIVLTVFGVIHVHPN